MTLIPCMIKVLIVAVALELREMMLGQFQLMPNEIGILYGCSWLGGLRADASAPAPVRVIAI